MTPSNPEIVVPGLIGSEKIIQDGIDSPHTPYPELVPTPEQPYPSVSTPAGLYTWDGSKLVNITQEAPTVPGQPVKTGYPYIVTFFRDGEEMFDVRLTNLKDVRILIRSVIMLYLGSNETIRLQYDVWDDGDQRWVDPSLDPKDMSRWPADWNGMMNAEIQIKGGLGDLI